MRMINSCSPFIIRPRQCDNVSQPEYLATVVLFLYSEEAKPASFRDEIGPTMLRPEGDVILDHCRKVLQILKL